MASTYSSNLGIELIGTGDQSGTWGSTTNTNLGTLIEQAISGYATQAVTTGADTTITIPNGSSGVARNMYIELTGSGGASTNLIVPANKKLYFIFNNTSSGQVTVKVSGQTGISVPNGKKMVLVSNGTDIVTAENYVASLSSDNLTLTGTLSVGSTSTFTGAATFTANPTLSGGTANGVLYLNGSKVATSGSALTFTGTNLGVGTSSPGALLQLGQDQATTDAAQLLLNDNASFRGEFGYSESGTTILHIANTYNDDASRFDIRMKGKTAADAKLTILGSGNVGIGTASPESTGRLTLDRASFNQLFIKVGGVEELRFYADASVSAISCASNPLLFETGGGEKMRLDSSGNLGLGVTPSAWGNATAFQLAKTSASNINGAIYQGAIGANNAGGITYNALYNGTTWQYIFGSSHPASRYEQAQGTHAWHIAGASTGTITFTQAMTLDASGNLGLGVTPSAWETYTALQIKNGSIANYSPTQDMRISSNAYYTSGAWKRIAAAYAVQYLQDGSTGIHAWFNAGTSTADSTISFTQAMTLDASGNLFVGGTTGSARLNLQTATSSSADSEYIRLHNAGENAGYISWTNGNGNLARITGTKEGGGAAADDGILTFSTSSNAATPTERARITSGGDFLIGGTSTTTIPVLNKGVYLQSTTNNAVIGYSLFVDESSNGRRGSMFLDDANGVFGWDVTASSGVPDYVWRIAGGEKARITSGGYFKASDAGTYNNSTGTYHELRQTANDTCAYISATNASMAYNVIAAVATRGASSAFNFLSCAANSVDQFYVRGDGVVYAQNTTIQSISDARLKENVRDASEGLNVINALRSVRYDWKEGFGNNRKDQLGFIAQEVEAVFPDAVSEWKAKEGEEAYKTVGPAALIPVLVKAIQELSAKVSALEAK